MMNKIMSIEKPCECKYRSSRFTAREYLSMYLCKHPNLSLPDRCCKVCLYTDEDMSKFPIDCPLKDEVLEE